MRLNRLGGVSTWIVDVGGHSVGGGRVGDV